MKTLPPFARILFVLAVCSMIAVGIFSVFTPTQEAQRVPSERKLAARYADFAKADRTTEHIREKRRRLIRVETSTDAARAAARALGDVVQDYGSFVVLSAPDGKRIPRGADVLKTTVHLPGAELEPLSETGDSIAILRHAPNDDGYHIVQFGTIANDELLDSLRDAGVEIIQYIPHQAFLVHGSSDAIGRAAAHSRVRWVDKHRPEHKISGQLRKQLAIARGIAEPEEGVAPLEYTSANTAKFSVAMVKREALNDAVSRVANASGGFVVSASDLPNNYFNVVQVEASADMVEQIANIPGVISIEPVYQRRAEDERSAHIVAGNYTNSTTISGPGYDPIVQFGTDGTNVTVAVSDDGINVPGNGPCYLSSGNVVNGPGYGSSTNAAQGHGHLNASIIAGAVPSVNCGLDATGHNFGMGIAPKAHIINIPFLINPSTDAQAANDVVTVPGPNGVYGSISNNSWGALTNLNSYNAYAAEYDGYVRDSSTAGTIDPVSFIFSAGNCGQGPANQACTSQTGLTQPKVAKNIIAVGSSENLRPEQGTTNANSVEDVSTFSSRGPAADGRIKPDIVAPGGAVSGSRTNASGGFSGVIDANHVYSFGTSHAAPQVAGVAALFTQFWKDGHNGQNPSPAMVKAAIINTGQEMTGVGAGTTLPNGNEGWGRVNMKYMFNTGTAMKHFDQLINFETVGQTRSFSGVVADSSKPVRITLVWTDPPGTVDPALVNNLDLTVTVGGNVYRGNVFSGGLSTTGGSADTKNNVENAWLPAGLAGPITVTITAVGLNGDGILGNVDTTDQNFAMVAYNADVTLNRGTPRLIRW